MPSIAATGANIIAVMRCLVLRQPAGGVVRGLTLCETLRTGISVFIFVGLHQGDAASSERGLRQGGADLSAADFSLGGL